jgi:hemoglobin/transferrin/lactoferrin receptor protein
VSAAPTETLTQAKSPSKTTFDAITVVGSKAELRLGEVPATVTVVEREELDRHQAQTLADLVRSQPGVTATGSAGRFGLDGLRIRGMEGNRVAISVDGVPAPQGFSVGSFSAAGRNVLDPELVDTVEILRGPASMIHGSDALGGAVVVHSRTVWTLVPDGAPWGLGLKTSWDGRDHGTRLGGWGAARGSRWSTLLQLSGRMFEELETNGSIPANPTTGWSGAAQLRAERSGTTSRLRMDATVLELESETDVDHLVGIHGTSATTTDLDADDRSTRLALVIRHESLFGPRATSSLTAHWSRDHTAQDTDQWLAPPGGGPATSLRRREFDLDQERYGAAWLGELDAGSHELLAGVDATELELEEQRDGLQTNLLNGTTTNVILGERLPVRDFPLSSMSTIGAFVGDRWTAPNGRLVLHLGMRFDQSDTTVAADPLYQTSYPGLEIVEASFSAWTPRAGATIDIGGGHSLYVSATDGFRAPPVFDTNVGLRLPVLGYEARPNPDLRPEHSRGYELGWRFAGPRLSLHLAAYQTRYRDLIESRALIGRDPATGVTVFQSINRNRATIEGIEGWLHADLGSDPFTRGSWDLDLALSAAEGRDTRLDVDLSSVDPARAVLSLGWSSADRRIGGDAVLTAVARTEVAATTPNGSAAFAPPGYETLDLHSWWRLGPGLTVRASLLNALDETYWVASRARRLATNDPHLELSTEPGRALVVSLEWRP